MYRSITSAACRSRIRTDEAARSLVDDSNSHSRRPSPLFKLSQELFYCIADFLEPVDVACLALCNKHLSICFERVVTWSRNLRARARQEMMHARIRHEDEPLPDGPRMDREFLQRLVRDSPKYYICAQCHGLHLVKHLLVVCSRRQAVGRPAYVPHIWVCTLTKPFQFDAHRVSDDFALPFCLVQLAMLRHRAGAPHGISLDWLTSTEIHISYGPTPTEVFPTIVELTMLTVEPLIVCDSMRLRVQHWMVLKPGEDLCKFYEIGSAENMCGVCHYYTSRREEKTAHTARLEALYDCKTMHVGGRQPQCETCSAYLQCSICKMPLHLQHVRVENRAAWVITKWLDIGTGADTNEHRFTRYRDPPYARNVPRIIGEGAEAASMRLAYEQESRIPLVQLTINNATLLIRNAYRERMTPRCRQSQGKHWYIDHTRADAEL